MLKKNNKPGHVYIIREREFINSNKPIYKIGRSENATVRLMGYPKGSEIEIIIRCEDMLKCENDLKRAFSESFKKMTDIGAEYYEGDIKEMKARFLMTVTCVEYHAELDAELDDQQPTNSNNLMYTIVSTTALSIFAVSKYLLNKVINLSKATVHYANKLAEYGVPTDYKHESELSDSDESVESSSDDSEYRSNAVNPRRDSLRPRRSSNSKYSEW